MTVQLLVISYRMKPCKCGIPVLFPFPCKSPINPCKDLQCGGNGSAEIDGFSLRLNMTYIIK